MKVIFFLIVSLIVALVPAERGYAAIITPTDIASQSYTLDGTGFIILDDAIFDSSFDVRSGAFWYNTADVTGTQMIYEEGGRVNGINVFIQDSSISVGAWQTQTGAWLTAPTTADEWHHVAYTYDSINGTFNLYSDGVLAASTATSGAIPVHTGASALGGVNGRTRIDNGAAGIITGGLFFDGQLSQSEFFDTALSPAEVTTMAAAAPVPLPTTIVLLASGVLLIPARKRSVTGFTRFWASKEVVK